MQKYTKYTTSITKQIKIKYRSCDTYLKVHVCKHQMQTAEKAEQKLKNTKVQMRKSAKDTKNKKQNKTK